MAVAVPEFWKLLTASRLVAPENLAKLQEKFNSVKGAAEQGNSVTLAAWLVAKRVLTPYQAKVLKSGRPGPFFYGDYVVYDRHAEGRLRRTFKAIHSTTRHPVLLVFFSGPAVQSQAAWSMVLRQMELFIQAADPHVMRMHQVCDLNQYKFVVAEDLTGRTAAERLAVRPLEWTKACRIVRHAALGAARLLDLGYVHGDIRPENIWLDAQRNAKLLLPPIARDVLEIPGPAALSAPISNQWLQCAAEYLAPEVSQMQSPLSPQTEVYALGCTLHHLITGKPPFAGADVAETLSKHISDEPEPLTAYNVPPEVAQVIAYMLRKNPGDRYQHPLEVAEALAYMLHQFDPAQLSLPSTPPPVSLPGFEAWLRHQPAIPETDWGMPFGGPPGIPPSIPVPAVPSPVVPTPPAFPSIVPQREVPIAPAEPIIVAVEPDAPTTAVAAGLVKPAQRRSASAPVSPYKKLIVAGVVAACLFVGLIVWTVYSNGPASPSPSQTATMTSQASSKQGGGNAPVESNPAVIAKTAKSSEADADNSQTVLVADDGETLWASPTEGAPISPQYLPPGVQWLMLVRPAELLKHSEAEKILAALGPSGETWRADLETLAGVPATDIESVLLSSIDPGTGAPGTIKVVRYVKPQDRQSLVGKWGNPTPTNQAAEEIFPVASAKTSAWLPSKEAGKVLVVGPHELVAEAVKAGGNRPPLRRDLEKMLMTTDSARAVSLVFEPRLLFSASGKSQSSIERLLSQAAVLFGTSRGAALSAALTNDDCFLELRIQGPLDLKAKEVAQQFLNQWNKVPDMVEAYLVSLNQSPHSRLILLRFPPMLRRVQEFTRSGEEGGQAVLRCYLPVAAAHNLIMGTELALAESASPPSTASTEAPKTPQTIAERLRQVTSLRFANEPLEKALGILADDIGVKMEVLGGDLEAEGITRNQAIVNLDENSRPASEIFRAIMLKANPDGKLVYVIRTGADGTEVLTITTRAAVAKRGDKLPEEFAEQ